MHYLLAIVGTLGLQRIPFFLNDNGCQLALQSNAVQQVVAYISAYTWQVFLYFTLAHAGHNHLIEVCAHTREGQPRCELRQFDMYRAVFVAALYSLHSAGQRAIAA